MAVIHNYTKAIAISFFLIAHHPPMPNKGQAKTKVYARRADAPPAQLCSRMGNPWVSAYTTTSAEASFNCCPGYCPPPKKKRKALVSSKPTGHATTSSLHVLVDFAAEKQNVWLCKVRIRREDEKISQQEGSGPEIVALALTWPVDHVVDPAARLLDAQVAPLRLCHQPILRHHLGNLLWQDHVPGENYRRAEECNQKVRKGALRLIIV